MGDVAYFGSVATTTKKTTASESSSSYSTTVYNTSKSQDTVEHTLTDDAAGGFGSFGTINYTGKTMSVRLVSLNSRTDGYASDYEDAKSFEEQLVTGSNTRGGGGSSASKGRTYTDNAVGEEVLATSTVTVTYAESFSSPSANTTSFAPPTVSIALS